MISNPIIEILYEHKLIKKKNIDTFSERTRDKKIPVFIDKKTGIIFNKYFQTKALYYQNKKTNRLKGNKKKTYSQFNFKNKITTLNLNDHYRRFLQFKNILKDKTLLDFGCGTGDFLLHLKKYCTKIYGIELSKEYLKNLKNKIKIYQNLESIKKDIRFDYITMFHVLEHLPNPIQILKNLKNRLERKGKIIIEVPSSHDFLFKFENLKNFRKFTFWSEHLILHTETSLKKFLKISGFKNIKISHFQRYNLANHVGWFLNGKPGGHERYEDFFSGEINESYKKFLEKNKTTDTLIAIASKE